MPRRRRGVRDAAPQRPASQLAKAAGIRTGTGYRPRRSVSARPEPVRHEPEKAPAPPEAAVELPGQALAAFYDRRAPAALAYCARLCEPESIAAAVEEAFGEVYSAASHGPARSDEELDHLLRDAVHLAAGKRASYASSAVEADRAYDALSGDEAPALGRSLLAEMLESPQEVAPPPPPPPPPAPVAATPRAERPPPKPSTLVALPPPAARRRRGLRLPHLAPGWRRRIAVVLGVIGLLLIAEVVVTLVWKEPFTAYLAAQTQDDLSKQLDKRNVALQANDQRALAAITNPDARTSKRMALLAQHLDAAVPDGEALGRINIDKLHVHYVFVQGTNDASLQKGPGHYHGNTLLPGQGGIVGIAGHRTTYEAPFREIPSLKRGDRIGLKMPYGEFTYEVTGHRIVPADYRLAFASSVGAGTGERLVLSACHPLYDAKQRILVEAKLIGSRPLGPAVETTAPVHLSAAQIAHRRYLARLKSLGHRALGPGITGGDVRQLQRLLGMPVTGLFDPNTTAAVIAFQRDHGLPQVGIVGGRTKRLLARRTHPPSRPPTPAPVPRPPTKYAPVP
ncbi:MAG TPA: sortase [Thermoleophilaceae bacterium]